MAKLSNINGKFAVEDTGAIRFSDQTGTTGQILKSNGNSAPTWVDPNTVGTGPWLPLAGGVVSGPTTFQSTLTVGIGGTGGNDSVLVINSGDAASGEAYINLKRNGSNNFLLNSTATGTQIRNVANLPLYFYTNNQIRLTIADGGNATFEDGVRVDGGDLILGDEAYSISADYVGMKTAFQSGSTDYMILSGTSDGSTYVSSKSGGATHIRGGGNNNAHELKITSSAATFAGNVGIGITAPGAILDIARNATKTNTGTSEIMYIGTSNEASNYATLQVYTVGATAAADRQWNFQTIEQGVANAGNISFQPSGGNVGIGTTGPATKLTVKGATQFGGNSTSTAALTSEFSAYGTTQNLYSITLQEGSVWSPGIAVINFAASRSGLQKHYAGQIIVRLTYYNQSGVANQGGWAAPSAVGAVVAYSGQAETYVRVYVNGTNTGNPQTIQIGVRDIDDTTNYFVSDIRVTLRSGALTITS